MRQTGADHGSFDPDTHAESARLQDASGGPSVPARLVIVCLRGYQRLVSPLMPPMCRFHPTCSQYFIDAVRIKGVLRGSLLGLWRLLRCSPLCKGGYDPVVQEEAPQKTVSGTVFGSRPAGET